MIPQRFTYPSPSFSHYWRQRQGIEMLKKLKNIPSFTEIEAFSELYMQSDDIADKVITDVFNVLGYNKAIELVENGLKNQKSEDTPNVLKEFIDSNSLEPQWLNHDLIDLGSEFCRRSGVLGLIVLRNYCLMGGYESSAINKPLIYTAELKKIAGKRIAETTEFWVNVTAENAMKLGEDGYISTIKLRLMHALARNHIQRAESWDNSKWGLPINQCDMVATNLGFSLIFLEGLKQLGIKPSEAEIAGLFHFWKYLGYLQGIPLDYLPDNEAEAIELLYKWTITQPDGDDDSAALAHSLMNAPLDSSFPKYKFQKWFIYKVNIGFNNFFLTKNACMRMKLPMTTFIVFPYLIKQRVQLEEKYFTNRQKQIQRGRKVQLEIRDKMLAAFEIDKKR